MKKCSLIILSVCLLLVFAGCKSLNNGDSASDTKVRKVSVAMSALADVNLETVYKDNGIDGYVLTVVNRAKQPVFIDWGNSSVSYGEDTSFPFPASVRYAEAVGEPVSATEIGVGEAYTDTIYCELQIFYNVDNSCWEVRPIEQFQTSVSICITDGKRFANSKFKTK